MRELHKPLIRNLAAHIVLMHLFIELCNRFVAGNGFHQLRFQMLLFRKNIRIGFLFKNRGKGFLVPLQMTSNAYKRYM